MKIAAGLRAHTDVADFYARAAVRRRIQEFLGARGGDGPAPSAVAGYGGGRWLRQPGEGAVAVPTNALPALFEAGADILRSRADPEGTLLVLDLDYVHPADPAESQREPMRCFEMLEPLHGAVLAALARLGMRPLVLMTLGGYQYIARAPVGGRLYAGLVEAGGAPEWRRASHDPIRAGRQVAAPQPADRGAGRLLQLVVHRTLRDVGPHAPLPIRLADLPRPAGAAFFRLDASAYADAPELHHVRCAFSADQTPLVTRPGAAIPFVVVLPRGEDSYRDLVPLRTDLERAARYAESACAAIPDLSDGAEWLRQYDCSGLAGFHREMDRAPLTAGWAYRPSGLVDPESFPACVGAVLRYPSPALLQPRHLRTVALALSSLGWHPRTIAALVGARYEEPHDWGTYWERHDAASRAEFFVRLFCAAAAEGLEDGGAFACGAIAHHGSCPPDGCGYDLELLFRRRRRLQVRDDTHA
jgi:hypothetical protein